MPDPNLPPPGQRPSIIQVIGSVMSAAFGVQSAANRERDFTGGSAKAYVVGGIIFTVLFVVLLISAVNYVLKSGPA